MKSKKGVELGMNFVVILILSIVAFGFGLKFLGDIINAGKNLPDFSPVEQILNSRMASGEKVAVYPSSATLKAGKKEIFGIGVLNVLGSQKTFKVSIASNPSGVNIIYDQDLANSGFILKNNEDRKISFVVDTKGAAKQTYVIDVQVTEGTNAYGAVQKVYVTVN